jgi:hypothetical protein
MPVNNEAGNLKSNGLHVLSHRCINADQARYPKCMQFFNFLGEIKCLHSDSLRARGCGSDGSAQHLLIKKTFHPPSQVISKVDGDKETGLN